MEYFAIQSFELNAKYRHERNRTFGAEYGRDIIMFLQ
jgi:hypothetical protein